MDSLSIAVIMLWLAVIALAIVVFALTRQIGVLFERVAPLGALITDAGPKVGEASKRFDLVDLAGRGIVIGAASARAQLVFFLSPDCPVCKKLLPVLKSTAAAESKWLDIVLASDGPPDRHRRFVDERKLDMFFYVLSEELGMGFHVSRLPYAVLIGTDGTVRAKGLVNNREQLDSLFNASDLGVASIQSYLAQGETPPQFASEAGE